ncbi:putative kinase binding protein cgi-121 protein [Phaeoacremonium minimum UCRPA7]|uniref:EKC/KEOPS complex subunit CGI121 n=1 Tax=Phaeoacremonium minimum (strain UCR-PA7) TaxID=1286976 RepID=R8B9C5_PHAM7|nr:putative kinase binding protein cgi-121 protein [Phaeoacremonium minimum UCRPA7]EON95898.1 putative kinase binding protein cgi-121 protein [Phaeoacremonium minimum UCRPA7]
MSLETITLEHVPPSHKVHVAFFKSVSNAAFLQSQLLARNPDFEYAFIDASSVVSRLQVLAVIYKALSILLDGTLRTPNVHSEIVTSLSASNNIAEAYRRYGITAETTSVIIVKVVFPTDARPEPPSAEHIWKHLQDNVTGSLVPFTDDEISGSTDWAKVRKYYKLNGAPSLNGLHDEVLKTKEAEMLVLGAMALRGV